MIKEIFDYLFEKRIIKDVRIICIIFLMFALVCVGSVYGFMHGAAAIDQAHYIAEVDGIATYRGFDSNIYHVTHDDFVYHSLVASFNNQTYDIPHTHTKNDLIRPQTTTDKVQYKYTRATQIINSIIKSWQA